MNYGAMPSCQALPHRITSASGEAAARWICVHHVERRPPVAPRSRVSGWQADREVGSRQQEGDEGRRHVADCEGDRGSRIGRPAVKIRSVTHNNRKKVFDVRVSTKTLVFPFAKADPVPTMRNPIVNL